VGLGKRLRARLRPIGDATERRCRALRSTDPRGQNDDVDPARRGALCLRKKGAPQRGARGSLSGLLISLG
jgi:hypothetical protein